MLVTLPRDQLPNRQLPAVPPTPLASHPSSTLLPWFSLTFTYVCVRSVLSPLPPLLSRPLLSPPLSSSLLSASDLVHGFSPPRKDFASGKDPGTESRSAKLARASRGLPRDPGDQPVLDALLPVQEGGEGEPVEKQLAELEERRLMT
eukprot:763517-Hanusia_phi.AAC.3